MKILISIAAFAVVLWKVDVKEVINQFSDIKWEYLIIAFILYGFSKFISAVRLKKLFHEVKINLSGVFNLKLYWLGMFYSLFLPGNISGDFYKFVYLKRNFNVRVRDVFGAIIIDRVNGAVILLLILAILATFFFNIFIVVLLMLFVFGLFYIILRRFFPIAHDKIFLISLYSSLVQGVQLIVAFVILIALGIPEIHKTEIYLFVFLVSSIAAALPISLGGMGARELVFVYFGNIFVYDLSMAISLSLIFQVMNLSVALTGGFVKLKSSQNVTNNTK